MKIVSFNQHKFIIPVILILLLSNISCQDDDDDEPRLRSPNVATISANEVTHESAEVIGKVRSQGSSTVSEMGVAWGLDSTITTDDNKVIYNEPGSGVFSVNISGLEPETRYYFRAYAINEQGTGYGKVSSFITDEEPMVPYLLTSEVTDVTLVSAKSGGDVISDEGFTVTARGVCWSTAYPPTIEDNITTDGAGIGSFESELSNLKLSTTYYIRAYATNSEGTGYGAVHSFTTGAIDIDGNEYNAIDIGNQTWMEPNLKTTKLADGESITKIEIYDNDGPSSLRWWRNENYPAYAVEGHFNHTDNYYYSWEAVNTGKLCPDGWRVPEKEDFEELINYLSPQPSTKLKSDYRWDGTNESGFNGYPFGWLIPDGLTRNAAAWWSNTEATSLSAYAMSLGENAELTGLHKHQSGLTVRCIKE